MPAIACVCVLYTHTITHALTPPLTCGILQNPELGKHRHTHICFNVSGRRMSLRQLRAFVCGSDEYIMTGTSLEGDPISSDSL